MEIITINSMTSALMEYVRCVEFIVDNVYIPITHRSVRKLGQIKTVLRLTHEPEDGMYKLAVMAFGYPILMPENPMNAMARRPAQMSAMGTPRIALGTAT